jgi:hypothetical protein
MFGLPFSARIPKNTGRFCLKNDSNPTKRSWISIKHFDAKNRWVKLPTLKQVVARIYKKYGSKTGDPSAKNQEVMLSSSVKPRCQASPYEKCRQIFQQLHETPGDFGKGDSPKQNRQKRRAFHFPFLAKASETLVDFGGRKDRKP